MTAKSDRISTALLGLLVAVDAGQVTLDPADHEYRRDGNPRILSGRVYAAEQRGLIRLDYAGRTITTAAGARIVEALDDELYAKPNPRPRTPPPPAVHEPVLDPADVIAVRRFVLVTALAGDLKSPCHLNTWPATRHGLPDLTVRKS